MFSKLLIIYMIQFLSVLENSKSSKIQSVVPLTIVPREVHVYIFQ